MPLQAALACQICSGMFFPVVRTGIGNHFGNRRYGEALAAVSVVEQLASIMAGPVVLAIYRAAETKLGFFIHGFWTDRKSSML